MELTDELKVFLGETARTLKGSGWRSESWAGVGCWCAKGGTNWTAGSSASMALPYVRARKLKSICRICSRTS